jgi:hypothetical protein
VLKGFSFCNKSLCCGFFFYYYYYFVNTSFIKHEKAYKKQIDQDGWAPQKQNQMKVTTPNLETANRKWVAFFYPKGIKKVSVLYILNKSQ